MKNKDIDEEILQVYSYIDSEKIYKALKHYKKLGYKLISVPTYVSEKAIDLTVPSCADKSKMLKVGNMYYTGSAEQSFVGMVLNHDIEYGKYMAITPCHRSDNIDEWHLPIFLKIELLHYGDFDEPCDIIQDTKEAELLNDVWCLYEKLVKNICVKPKIEVVPTDIGVDINVNGYETGSYGFRRIKDHHAIWYGTGLAEPRFSSALLKTCL